jgi:methenyltetrahydromethanopterin cyclohydrolase
MNKGALPILKMYQFLYDNEITIEPFEQYPISWLIEESRYSKGLTSEIIKYLSEIKTLSEDKKKDLIKQVQAQTKDTNSQFD